MAGVHRSLQFPSLSAQPCAPASALLRTCTCMSTHTLQLTDHHSLTLSRVNTEKHVKLYNVLNCHLDNTLTVAVTSQPVFFCSAQLDSSENGRRTQRPPLGSAGDLRSVFSSCHRKCWVIFVTYGLVTRPYPRLTLPFSVSTAQMEHSAEEDRLSSAQKR